MRHREYTCVISADFKSWTIINRLDLLMSKRLQRLQERRDTDREYRERIAKINRLSYYRRRYKIHDDYLPTFRIQVLVNHEYVTVFEKVGL